MVPSSLSLANDYWSYLESQSISLSAVIKATVQDQLGKTDWESPRSALDCNTIAVLALIEAEQSEPSVRSLYLETAITALEPVAYEHPLCAAHLALIHSLLGNSDLAINLAFSAFIDTLQKSESHSIPMGLVYLPERSLLQSVLQAETGSTQALFCLGAVLQCIQPIFYNPTGLRFLSLAAQVLPTTVPVCLKLGIAQLIGTQWEGLFALHQARQLAPNHPAILQALYLAYRDLRQDDIAETWLEHARELGAQSDSLDLRWTHLSIDNPMTYVPFDQILLAVEASFDSIVTSVLVAQGDWFERELEFWRSRIQLGMTVIDVGANVGVYTFSAAQRVGQTGRVIAVEPFSGCVRCLEETCQMNRFSQVRVCAGAASDRAGRAKLALQRASELNEVVTDDCELATDFEEITCLTLDSLIDSENLNRVDFLKIDAEGHEMQVLQGSDRILAEFKPVILYENIAGSKGSNLAVAEYLLAKEYQLFRYQPYLEDLIALDSLDSLQGNLNIIAVPAETEG